MSTKEFTFMLIFVLALGYVLGFTVCNSKSIEPEQPTVKCTDGKFMTSKEANALTCYGNVVNWEETKRVRV